MVPEYELNEGTGSFESPYRIIYLIESAESRVEVLAVIHRARKQVGQ
jgi:hypothetical protein